MPTTTTLAGPTMISMTVPPTLLLPRAVQHHSQSLKCPFFLFDASCFSIPISYSSSFYENLCKGNNFSNPVGISILRFYCELKWSFLTLFTWAFWELFLHAGDRIYFFNVIILQLLYLFSSLSFIFFRKEHYQKSGNH